MAQMNHMANHFSARTGASPRRIDRLPDCERARRSDTRKAPFADSSHASLRRKGFRFDFFDVLTDLAVALYDKIQKIGVPRKVSPVRFHAVSGPRVSPEGMSASGRSGNALER